MENTSKFLDGLKTALDKGEFNSEAAAHLTEIHRAAENVNAREAGANQAKNIEANPAKPVSENEAKEKNEMYENKISKLKELDGINRALVVLINLEADVEEAKTILEDEISSLTGEFIKDKPQYDELKEKVASIKKHFKFK